MLAAPSKAATILQLLVLDLNVGHVLECWRASKGTNRAYVCDVVLCLGFRVGRLMRTALHEGSAQLKKEDEESLVSPALNAVLGFAAQKFETRNVDRAVDQAPITATLVRSTCSETSR